MIRRISFTNFKCFPSLHLPVKGLTLLTGLNGAGKTSVQQALLLLRQSHLQQQLVLGNLALNGDLVQIGAARDALAFNADDDSLGFSLRFDNESVDWRFRYDSSADVLSASKAPANEIMQRISQEEGLFSQAFQYICAERVGPRVSSPTADYGVRVLRQLGSRGEYTPYYLSQFGRELVTDEVRLHPNQQERRSLNDQVEAWLGEISPGARLKIKAVPDLDLVQIGFEFVYGREVSPTFRPTNVGFGLSYVLSLIVAVLAAKPGALLLIENPEAHLHPRGQLKMGEFLARSAAAGVQILLETHSDHILNGVRLAVYDGLIRPDMVGLHYFERGEQGSVLHSPVIDKDGRIDPWPSGFFDEWDVALDRLLAPRKN